MEPSYLRTAGSRLPETDRDSIRRSTAAIHEREQVEREPAPGHWVWARRNRGLPTGFACESILARRRSGSRGLPLRIIEGTGVVG